LIIVVRTVVASSLHGVTRELLSGFCATWPDLVVSNANCDHGVLRSGMKACFLAMLSLLFTSFSSAQLLYTKKQVVAYAKSIGVQMLDSSLPS
jgi:hypothetical protein